MEFKKYYKGIKQPTEASRSTNIGRVFELKSDGKYYMVDNPKYKSLTKEQIQSDVEKGFLEEITEL